MAKRKRLDVKKLADELRLIACGACEGTFTLDGDCFDVLPTMGLAAISRFANAIASQYFDETNPSELDFMSFIAAEHWADYDTLAKAIADERARLEAKNAG